MALIFEGQLCPQPAARSSLAFWTAHCNSHNKIPRRQHELVPPGHVEDVPASDHPPIIYDLQICGKKKLQSLARSELIYTILSKKRQGLTAQNHFPEEGDRSLPTHLSSENGYFVQFPHHNARHSL